MKSKIISYCSAGCCLCMAAYVFVGHQDSEMVERNRPVVRSFTTSPDVPPAVRFCGATVDLTRYNMRENMDRELSSFTYYHSSTLLLIKRANRYFPIIEPILRENGMPDDLKYIAVIESGLDPKISSPAHAVGMWQFIESAGRRYGLRMNASVDERRNVAKSTEAACRYLREAYDKYGDWMAAAASYNAGMGRISEKMEEQSESSVLNLYLVDETTRYPYRILAAKLIFENPYKYGFILRAEDLYRPIATREITVNEDIADLPAFARKKGVTYYDLKFFNPWLKDKKLVTGGAKYTILLPYPDDLYYDEPNGYVHDKRWVVRLKYSSDK